MTVFYPSDDPLAVTLLILPDCSMMSVACTLDPMRAANRISGTSLFTWDIQTLDGNPVEMTCGLPVAAHAAFGALTCAKPVDNKVLIIIAGFDSIRHAQKDTVTKLFKLSKDYNFIGGVETGSWLLARAGLLNGRKATTHWEELEDFAAAYPAIDVIPDRFVIDGRYFTTGGASPTFDFMLHLIRLRRGTAFAIEVASVFIYDETHPSTQPQPLASLGRLQTTEPRIAAAIKIMEAHLDEPVSIVAIAQALQISVRLLELLFKSSMQYSPGGYYRHLRLQAARRLIIETRLSFQEIAVRTGFNSLSAFSRAFKNHMGQCPGQWRKSNRPDHAAQSVAFQRAL